MIAYTEHPQRILEMWELNAFLASAVSPQLKDPSAMQSVPVQNLTIRGVQLSNLFMQGVEHAILANDACGAPVPWHLFSPWLFFDGKLLQLKLEIANRKRDSLMDLCTGEMDQIAAVDRMRQAVLEGLEFLFALPHPQALAMMNPVVADQVHQRLSAVARGRGMVGRREILARGGQLKIGGVVVSQWSGNVDKFDQNRHPSVSPEITSVGNQNSPRGRGAPPSVGVVRLPNPNLGLPPVVRGGHAPVPTPYPNAQVPYRGQASVPQSRPIGVTHGQGPPVIQEAYLSYFPVVGTPVNSSSALPPPPPQFGAAGYSLEALQRYQMSAGNNNRGRGRAGAPSNTIQRGKVVKVGPIKQRNDGINFGAQQRWNYEMDNRVAMGTQPVNSRIYQVPSSVAPMMGMGYPHS